MKTNDNRPIICGTDFSENAARAAETAAAIAERLNATLIVAHSVDERGDFQTICGRVSWKKMLRAWHNFVGASKRRCWPAPAIRAASRMTAS